MLANLTALLHALGDMVGAMGVVMTGDVTNATQTGGPDGMADFFGGLVMLVGTAGAGLGEVMTALGTFLGQL